MQHFATVTKGDVLDDVAPIAGTTPIGAPSMFQVPATATDGSGSRNASVQVGLEMVDALGNICPSATAQIQLWTCSNGDNTTWQKSDSPKTVASLTPVQLALQPVPALNTALTCRVVVTGIAANGGAAPVGVRVFADPVVGAPPVESLPQADTLRGSVVANGVTAVNVAVSSLSASSRVLLTRTVNSTPGKDPQVTKTAGVGFAIVADAGDVSTYEWIVL